MLHLVGRVEGPAQILSQRLFVKALFAAPERV